MYLLVVQKMAMIMKTVSARQANHEFSALFRVPNVEKKS